MPDQDESLVGIVEVSRREAQLLLEAGYIYMELGKFQEADDVFQGVCSLLPKNDVPRIALGHLFMSQSRIDEAIQSYKNAIKLRPESATAHAFLGEAYLFKGKTELALPTLQKAQELDTSPEEEGSARRLALSLLQAHKEGAFST